MKRNVRSTLKGRSVDPQALEQLRALWHGFRIAVIVEKGEPERGVDTPADLAYITRKMKKR